MKSVGNLECDKSIALQGLFHALKHPNPVPFEREREREREGGEQRSEGRSRAQGTKAYIQSDILYVCIDTDI